MFNMLVAEFKIYKPVKQRLKLTTRSLGGQSRTWGVENNALQDKVSARPHLTQDIVHFTGNQPSREPKITSQIAALLPKKTDITQQELDMVFKDEEVAKALLTPAWFNEWQKVTQEGGDPSTGFCRKTAEFFHYFVDPNTILYKVSLEGTVSDSKGNEEPRGHYFLGSWDEDQAVADPKKCVYSAHGRKVYDPTIAQFGNNPPEYLFNKAITPSRSGFPSAGACLIAAKLGLVTTEFHGKAAKLFTSNSYKSWSRQEKLAELKKIIEEDQTVLQSQKQARTAKPVDSTTG